MFRRPVKEINAEVVAEEKYLDSLQRIAREACLSTGLSKKEVTPILLAIEEGATNIIRHAYLYEKGTIRLRIVIYKKMIVFSLIDTGRSYQPDTNGKLDLRRLVDSGRKGGLGFYMIRKIMDSVEYISSAGYNELRMIKRSQPIASESIPFLRHMATLRVKFSVWTFLIVLVIVGGAYYYFDSQTTRQLKSHLDETVSSLMNTIADQAAGYVINRRSDVEFDELIVSSVRSNAGMLRQVVLTDSAGTIMAHSDDIHNIRKPYLTPPEVRGATVGVPYRYEASGRPLSYLMMPIRQGEHAYGMVHAVYSSELLQQRLAEARRRILVLTFALLLVGIAGIWVLSNYFVEPIVRITQRVRRFASGDLQSELPLEGAEEFYEISRAFNDLLTRVSQDRENIVAREKMVKEIEVASQIQKTLMPTRLPDLPGLEIDTFYHAAAVVGGDLYDVFEIDPGTFCLVVADVSGKGVPASLVMSMLRTVVQIQAGQSHSSRRTLILVHEYLRDNIPPGMFITIMLAVYDSERRKMNFVSAGHNPLLYYHAASGEIRLLNPAGMPMGVPAAIDTTFEQRLEQYELELGEGDFFFMFTDGITEASSREGQYYGMDRLVRFMKAQLTGGEVRLDRISAALMEELEEFCGLAGPADDVTFILGRSGARHPEGLADVAVNEADRSPQDRTVSGDLG